MSSTFQKLWRRGPEGQGTPEDLQSDGVVNAPLLSWEGLLPLALGQGVRTHSPSTCCGAGSWLGACVLKEIIPSYYKTTQGIIAPILEALSDDVTRQGQQNSNKNRSTPCLA